MKKMTVRYICYILLGALLGILMQRMPLLKGQWGQNIFNYMASDLGVWAVICILIITYAGSPLQAGLQSFLCMAAMVAGYYICAPWTFTANIRWVITAILIFPIGIIGYGYQKKLWVVILLELFLGGCLILQGMVLAQMLSPDYQMIVLNKENVYVFTNPTIFSIGNYVLLMACTVFGMVFTFCQYRLKYNEKKEDI